MKKSNAKRLAAASLALALTFALPMQAFAETWYLDEGDITISATEEKQTVTQNDTTEDDDNPTITQKDKDTPTGNTITVETTGNAVAQFTIDDVNIKTSVQDNDGNTGGSAIEIGDSKAEITISGDNTLESQDSAGIHVRDDGELTIHGDGDNDKDTLTAIGHDNAAGIGSNKGESLSGSITIESGTVTGRSEREGSNTGYGAGIGTGQNGALSGSINISGGDVTGTSAYSGAGIGTGNNGNLSGSVNISGGDVKGTSTLDGAGIGTGSRGALSGSINISGGEVEGRSEANGAGIGTGSYGDLSGSINISGDNVTGTSAFNGAGIGTGYDGDLSGIVDISGGGVTGTSAEDGAGIGTGWDGDLSGNINITGGDVIGTSTDYGAGIGTGLTGFMNGTIRILEYAEVTANGSGSVIGAGEAAIDNGTYYKSDSATVTANNAPWTSATKVGEYDLDLTESKAATCTEAGYKTYTYTDADAGINDSYTVPIPATGHTYDAEETPATAGHQGYTTYTCSCGECYVSDYTAALPVEEDTDDNSSGNDDNGSGTENGGGTVLTPVIPDNTENTGATSPGTEINAMPIEDINDLTEIIWNQHDDVSAVVPVGTGGYLHESEISDEAYAQIIADVTGEVVCTAHLAYSGDNEPHSYKLTFHLDKVYAGRTIRVYLLTDNGERKTWTVTADANGGVTFTTSDLGSFVLAVID